MLKSIDLFIRRTLDRILTRLEEAETRKPPLNIFPRRRRWSKGHHSQNNSKTVGRPVVWK